MLAESYVSIICIMVLVRIARERLWIMRLRRGVGGRPSYPYVVGTPPLLGVRV